MPQFDDRANGNYLDIETFSDTDLAEQVDVSITEIPDSYGSPEAYLADHGLNLPNKITGSLCFNHKDGTVAFVSKKDINWKLVHRLMLTKIAVPKQEPDSIDTTRSDVHNQVIESGEMNQESGM